MVVEGWRGGHRPRAASRQNAAGDPFTGRGHWVVVHEPFHLKAVCEAEGFKGHRRDSRPDARLSSFELSHAFMEAAQARLSQRPCVAHAYFWTQCRWPSEFMEIR